MTPRLTFAEFKARRGFSFEELVAAAEGRLIEGRDGPLLSLALLMPFHSIAELSWDEARGAGRLVALRRNRVNDWFYACHFINDPVMPGCWGLDALWQGLRFFAAWRGLEGCDKALGMEDVSFFGQIRPYDREVAYELEVRSIEREAGETIITASGKVKVDGALIYTVGTVQVGTCHWDENEAPLSPPADRPPAGSPLAGSLSREDYASKTSFTLPELIAHARGNLIQADGSERIHIPAALMAGLEEVQSLAYDQASGEGEMVAARDNGPLDWFYPLNHGRAPAAFLIDIAWQALGFFLSWRLHPGTGRALGFESVRVFGDVGPSAARIVCRARINRIFEATNGDAFILGDAALFADGRPVVFCANAKVGCHKDIAYEDYPMAGRMARGGKLELGG